MKRTFNQELIERLATTENERDMWRDAYNELLALFNAKVKD